MYKIPFNCMVMYYREVCCSADGILLARGCSANANAKYLDKVKHTIIEYLGRTMYDREIFRTIAKYSVRARNI